MLFVHYDSYVALQGITVTSRQESKYQELADLGRNINSREYREEGACISTNRDTLYFASDRPGGFGGFDIYFSLKLPNDEWGPPQNIGASINTEYDENYPNLAENGSVMYFCSQGHNSMGGYDIFSSYKDSLNNWQNPANLGYPLNTIYDDRTITMVPSKRYAYISTRRSDSFGGLDIYKVVFNGIEPQFIIYKGFIGIGSEASHKSVTSVESQVMISIYNKPHKTLYGQYSINQSNGKYIIALKPGAYELKIEGEKIETFTQDIEVLDSYYNNKEVINNIFLKEAE